MKNRWNNRMKNRLLVILLLVSMVGMMVSGCSLAKEETSAEGKTDQMIGALVIDSVFDELNSSDLVEAELTKGEDGSPNGLNFPGIKGRYMAYYQDTNKENCFIILGDDGFFDGRHSYNVNDSGIQHEYSSSVCYLLGEDEEDQPVFHMHPIYERSDGTVYAAASVNSAEGSPYGELSLSLSDKVTITKNGAKQEEESIVKLTFIGMNLPVSYTVLQYSDDHKLLSRQDYKSDQLLEEIKAEKGMAYVIVSSEQEDAKGNMIQKRTLYDKDDEGEVSIVTYKKTDSSLLDAEHITVK